MHSNKLKRTKSKTVPRIKVGFYIYFFVPDIGNRLTTTNIACRQATYLSIRAIKYVKRTLDGKIPPYNSVFKNALKPGGAGPNNVKLDAPNGSLFK
jgi:hypothetical protein